jgi:thioesterase domain-containing protein
VPIRRSEADLQSLLNSGAQSCITVAAKDRFGAYGNVGAVLYSVKPATLEVESFLLSCRALGRGVEHQIVRHLGVVARNRNLAELRIPFRPTKKNIPALRFLESLSATREDIDGVDTFRLSSDTAAQLAFQPVSYNVAAAQKIALSDVPSEATTFNRYGWIASGLRTPEQVLGAISRGAKIPPPDFADSAPATSYAQPTDEYEQPLCEIWEKVLGRNRIGIHENFFEIGGDSLLAVRALSRVLERWPYHRLTIAVFLAAPTIAQFADVIRSGKQVMTQLLVPFRQSGKQYPFFCIPGAGGNVVSLRTFSRGFSEDQPLYCIQAKGLDGSEPCTTVEAHARHYLPEIRKVQAKGPYHLGGMCFGGLVAFELAHLLRAQGEEVALLALLDTYNPAFASTLSKRRLLQTHLSFYWRRATFHLRSSSANADTNRWQHLKAKTRALPRYFANLLPAALRGFRKAAYIPPLNEIGAEYRGFLKDALNRVAKASTLAASQYAPKYYDGRVVVFTASERFVEPYEDDALGWRPFVRHVEAIELPGTHTSFLTGLGRSETVRRIEAITAAETMRDPTLTAS